jgi:hypothetical protein
MKVFKKLAIILVVITFTIGIVPLTQPSLAQPVELLTNSYRITLEGDVISAGVGLRGVGTGSISLPDLPPGANVVKAYLLWATIGNDLYPELTLNNTPISGSLIGVSANTCWESPHFLQNYVYRADVTSRVDGGGEYEIDGLPSDLETGNDSQGASLIVVYSLPGSSLRTILINDGAVTLDTVKTTYTDTLSGFWADDPVSEAKITLIVGDGQEEYNTGDVTFNGELIARDEFMGTAGDYWDDLTYEVTDYSPISPSTTTIENQLNGSTPDCLVWAATVFSVTTEMVMEVENQLSQAENILVYGGVTSAGVGLRGEGSGEILIDGIPEGAGVYRAYLYWGVLGTTGAFENPRFNGNVAQGEVIGISGNVCWPPSHLNLDFYSFNFRADVTEYVSGNGTYAIQGLPSNLSLGNDSQGASLVVIYSYPTLSTLRHIIINHGAVTLDTEIHSYTDTIEGFEGSDPLLEAEVTYLVTDGQDAWETGDVVFNDQPIAFDVFKGTDGDYWDTLSFDVTDLNPTSPSTTRLDNIHPLDGPTPDCINWVATIFSATPPQPDLDHFIYVPLVTRND